MARARAIVAIFAPSPPSSFPPPVDVAFYWLKVSIHLGENLCLFVDYFTD